MRTFAPAILLAVNLCSLPTLRAQALRSEQNTSTVSAVERADREFAAAMVKADVRVIENMLAETYTFTDPTGRVSTKKDVLDGFKSGAIRIESHDISDVHVWVYGNAAIATGLLTSKAMRDGRDSGGTFRFTRVWVSRDGKWRTVAFQETRKQ